MTAVDRDTRHGGQFSPKSQGKPSAENEQNARKAGVGRLIEFREADATKMSLPTDKGLLVCNPPYGERMLEQRSAQRLYGAFGRHLKYADGWKKYIISSEPEFEHYFGRQAVKKRKLYNGRLQCNVYMYY